MRPLVIVLVVLLLAAGGWLLWERNPREARVQDLPDPVAGPGVEDASGAAAPPAEDPARAGSTDQAREAADELPGQGVLVARIRATAGAALPEDWTLRILPQPPHWSDFDPEAELRAMEEEDQEEADASGPGQAEGTDTAGGDEEDEEDEDAGGEDGEDEDPPLPPASEHRVTGSDQVEVRLPLGRYRVLARSAYARSPGVPVHLAAKAPRQEVTLEVAPIAVVLGRVQARTDAVAGLPVIVEEIASGERFSVQANADGEFRVEGVAAGPARVAFGSWERPLLPRRKILIEAPLTEIPRVELPRFGALEVWVTDARGEGVSGATVSVVGMEGGSFAGRTDPSGKVVCGFLGTGPARVVAVGDRDRANARVVILPSRTVELRLTLDAR